MQALDPIPGYFHPRPSLSGAHVQSWQAVSVLLLEAEKPPPSREAAGARLPLVCTCGLSKETVLSIHYYPTGQHFALLCERFGIKYFLKGLRQPPRSLQTHSTLHLNAQFLQSEALPVLTIFNAFLI